MLAPCFDWMKIIGKSSRFFTKICKKRHLLPSTKYNDLFIVSLLGRRDTSEATRLQVEVG